MLMLTKKHAFSNSLDIENPIKETFILASQFKNFVFKTFRYNFYRIISKLLQSATKLTTKFLKIVQNLPKKNSVIIKNILFSNITSNRPKIV